MFWIEIAALRELYREDEPLEDLPADPLPRIDIASEHWDHVTNHTSGDVPGLEVAISNSRQASKSKLASIVAKAITSSFTEANIKAGFQATGIWPLNPSVVKFEGMPCNHISIVEETTSINDEDISQVPTTPVNATIEGGAIHVLNSMADQQQEEEPLSSQQNGTIHGITFTNLMEADDISNYTDILATPHRAGSTLGVEDVTLAEGGNYRMGVASPVAAGKKGLNAKIAEQTNRQLLPSASESIDAKALQRAGSMLGVEAVRLVEGPAAAGKKGLNAEIAVQTNRQLLPSASEKPSSVVGMQACKVSLPRRDASLQDRRSLRHGDGRRS
ncbi:hypothetical protein L7F22_043138 [Adiantum nelumboides]|nr:hypothetical protein [Adiantum nelumboides]